MRASLLILACGAAAPAAAQEGTFVPVDRIVAVIGSTPIALSRVDEELNLVMAEMQRAGRPVPTAATGATRARRSGPGRRGRAPIP